MAIVMSSRMQKGTRCIWMSRYAYANHMKINKGLSEVEAFAPFVREVNMLPPDRVSADKEEILFPVERFVVMMEEQSHEEHTQYGTKASLCKYSLCSCLV